MLEAITFFPFIVFNEKFDASTHPVEPRSRADWTEPVAAIDRNIVSISAITTDDLSKSMVRCFQPGGVEDFGFHFDTYSRVTSKEERRPSYLIPRSQFDHFRE